MKRFSDLKGLQEYLERFGFVFLTTADFALVEAKGLSRLDNPPCCSICGQQFPGKAPTVLRFHAAHSTLNKTLYYVCSGLDVCLRRKLTNKAEQESKDAGKLVALLATIVPPTKFPTPAELGMRVVNGQMTEATDEVEEVVGTKDFVKELDELINRHSMENGSNTPDFILATYLMQCLNAYNHAVNARDKYRGD